MGEQALGQPSGLHLPLIACIDSAMSACQSWLGSCAGTSGSKAAHASNIISFVHAEHGCAAVQVVLKVVQPYTRIRIPFMSKQLNIPEADVERLLVSLILDKRIEGHIDQV